MDFTIGRCGRATIKARNEKKNALRRHDVNLCLAFAYNNYCGAFILTTYRDYFLLLARLRKKALRPTITEYLSGGGANPGGLCVPVWTYQNQRSESAKIIKFAPMHVWSKEQVAEICCDFVLFKDYLDKHMNCHRTFLQIDYWPFSFHPAKLATHIVVVEKRDGVYGIYDGSKRFEVRPTYSKAKDKQDFLEATER